MWGVIPIYLRRNTAITDKAKLLYAEISDNTDETGVCRKSNEELAEYMGISSSSLRKFLYELRDLEIIGIDGDGKDRRISFPERLVLVDVTGKEEKKRKKLKEDLAISIADFWNKEVTTGRGIKVTPNLINVITSRCKNFSDEDVMLAVVNRASLVKASEWHNKDENIRHRNDIYLVLRTDKDLEKHVNINTSKIKEKNGGANEINVYRFS